MISLEEQIKEVRREIGLRRHVYPQFVVSGRITQAKADKQISAMEAALATLEAVARCAIPLLDEEELLRGVGIELAEIIMAARPTQRSML